MEKLIAQIQGLSTNDDNDLKQLKNTLIKSEETMFKHISSIDDALSVLDPYQHSLGWLYLLSVKALGKTDPFIFIPQLCRFLNNFNAKQVRMDPKKFRFLCQKLTDICCENKIPHAAVKALRSAVTKFAPREQLTPQHAMFALCCLLSKLYTAAQSVLDIDVIDVDPELTAVETKDLRLYFYYGGMLYVGLKKFHRALEFFKNVISAPAIIPSQIMVEAYKKYILVSLIISGQIQPLPRYTSTTLLRHLRHTCTAYENLANAHATHSLDDVQKCVASHQEQFVKEGNWGLVKQSTKSLIRRNIQRLTLTYLTLSLQDIAENVKLKSTSEVEQLILRMIENGEIFAALNQKAGMAIFKDNPEAYNTAEALEYLDKQIKNTIVLTGKIERLDELITATPTYLQKAMSTERTAGTRFSAGELEEGFDLEHAHAGFRG
jgi:COP9 signalosome complex subunit 3